MKILILYYSKTGHTLEAANATAEGIRLAGSKVDVINISDFNTDSIQQYDGIILGSPCWAGSITNLGIAKPLAKVINIFPEDCLNNKRSGSISVHSKRGGLNTVKTICKLLSQKGSKDCRPGPVAKAGVPFSLWKGPSISKQDKESFSAFGKDFVT